MTEPPPISIWPLVRGLMLSIVMATLLMGSCTVGCKARAYQYGERCRDAGGVRSRLDCHMPRLTRVTPEGWVFQTTGDLKPVYRDMPDWRKALDHYDRLAVSADFDGDGREDQAAILLGERFERFAVFAFPAGGEPIQLTPAQAIAALPGRSLAVEDAGEGGRPALILKQGGRALERFGWNGTAFVKTAG